MLDIPCEKRIRVGERRRCFGQSLLDRQHAQQKSEGGATSDSDIRTTRRYYVQVEPELMQRACRAVETALAEAEESEDGAE